MIILTDTREQRPYSFRDYQTPTEAAALSYGDYSLKGFQDRIAVERKSLNDLIGCLTGSDRTLFEKELARAGSFERFCVVVEANLQDISGKCYRSVMEPHAVIQSVMAFYIRYGIPFLFCGDRGGAEYMTYWIIQKYHYEIEKRFKALERLNQL